MFSTPTEFQLPSEWIYRGEGNCNVCIALPKQKKILRIRKINRTTSILRWIINWLTGILYWYCGNNLNEESRDLKFYNRIIRPLFGRSYIGEGQQVFVTKKQVAILEKELEKSRPEFRKHKGLQYGRAALFDDYAFLPDDYYPFPLSPDTFAIEIKPKQGWIPFNEKQYPKCIFCMHQHLKKQNGQINKITSYCPLALFSGDPARMDSALRALIENPQNNFKIFKNGQLIYSEHESPSCFNDILNDFFKTYDPSPASLTAEFCSLIRNCLLTNFETKYQPIECQQKLFCEWNQIIYKNSAQNKLPKGCVLEKIYSVQMLDVEGHQYYNKLLGNQNLNNYNYVNQLFNEIGKCENACLNCSIMMLANANSDTIYAPYLISAIAKDCSLMLTFQKITENLSDNLGVKNVVCTKNGSFVVNIAILDLYPKPISTITKHRKKIKKILELCN